MRWTILFNLYNNPMEFIVTLLQIWKARLNNLSDLAWLVSGTTGVRIQENLT